MAAGPVGNDLDRRNDSRRYHVFEPGVKRLGILPNHDKVDSSVGRLETRHRFYRPNVGEKFEFLSEAHICRNVARANRCGRRTFQSHTAGFDLRNDILRQRVTELFDRAYTDLSRNPLHRETRRFDDPATCFDNFGPDTVAGQQYDTMFGHDLLVSCQEWGAPCSRTV